MGEYTGNWDRYAAGHLLRRSLFGPTPAQINNSLSIGKSLTVEGLLSEELLLDLPLAYNAIDPVGIGNTWIEAPFNQGAVGVRIASFQSWWIYQMLNANTIHQKLILFWHNHFAVESTVVRDARMLYRYYRTIHEYALGNIKTLTQKITIEAAMLRYLNGDSNTRIAPNENYARELFELFTIGKGPQIGAGNYTHFTEDDVFAAARVLTGWRVNGQSLEVSFRNDLHDLGEKHFSEAFGEVVISNQGEDEFKSLVNLIFDQKETARNFCRKLYRWFLFHEIDQEAEQEIIEPMANQLFADDYHIKGTLQLLFNSAHFFQNHFRGAMIKNPMDFVLGTLRSSSNVNEVALAAPVQQRYGFWRGLNILTSQMQMTISNPPQVAGWEAYYQAPAYYRSWINSATLPIRKEFLENLHANIGLRISGMRVQVQYIPLVYTCSDPENVREVIRTLSALYLAHPLSAGLEDFLVEALIPGLPEYEWGNQWRILDSNPQDNNLKMAIEAKLQGFFIVLCNLPEFQLG